MIGALAVVSLFGVLLWRGVRAGNRAPDPFGTLPRPGASPSLLVLQALLNISVDHRAAARPRAFRCRSSPTAARRWWSTLAACGVLLNVSQHG